MDDRLRSIAAQAASRHGVFTPTEWAASGMSARQLTYAVSTGSVVRLGPHAFVFPGVPTSFEQRLTAALAEFPNEADEGLAGGLAAGRLLRLDVPRTRDVELSVARVARGRARSLPFLVRSHGPLNPVDRVEVDGFPCLAASRLIIEEAGRWPASTLESAVDSALRLGWTSPTFLRSRLSALRTRGKRGVRALDRALDGTGGHNWLEREFLRLVKASGLRAPETQMTFRRDGVTVARVDSVWKDERLVVEVAGHQTHSSRLDRQRDAQRQTELTALGYRVVTFTYDDVAERPGWVVESLRRLGLSAA